MSLNSSRTITKKCAAATYFHQLTRNLQHSDIQVKLVDTAAISLEWVDVDASCCDCQT
jgi:hypothetical protein